MFGQNSIIFRGGLLLVSLVLLNISSAFAQVPASEPIVLELARPSARALGNELDPVGLPGRKQDRELRLGEIADAGSRRDGSAGGAR